MSEPNRDLVLAILAVLTDSIPRDRFAAVLASWSETRQTPLAQWLRQAPGMDDEKFRALESLAAVHLRAHGNDIRQSLDALNAQAMTMEVLTEIADDGQRIALDKTLGADATMPVERERRRALGCDGRGQEARWRSFSTDPAARTGWNRPGVAGA